MARNRSQMLRRFDVAVSQERRIGHVRGMSAEPSTTEVGVPIGDIGSSNGPHSPVRRPARDTVVGPRPADASWTYNAQTLGELRADTPRIPSARSLQRRDRGAGGQGARAQAPVGS
jgi:hypothetical protein